jgi:hypothetical protein
MFSLDSRVRPTEERLDDICPVSIVTGLRLDLPRRVKAPPPHSSPYCSKDGLPIKLPNAELEREREGLEGLAEKEG